jgi:adenosine deaminase CECR1
VVSTARALVVYISHTMPDSAFRQSLSPIGKEACQIVARIREKEQNTIWTSKLEDELAKETSTNVYPGMMFSLAKERMETTKLWQIIRKMPKGALLHAHLDAMVDFDFLFDYLLSTPGMHVQCAHDLSTAQKLETGSLKFCYRKSECRDTNIWANDYHVNTPVLVSEAADSFPNGGRPGFLEWLKGRFTITNNESIEHHHGVDAVWKKFQSIFVMINGIVFYEPIFRAFMQRMLQLLLADGVKWIDLRLAFRWQWYRDGHEEPEVGYSGFFKAFGEEIEKFKASEEGKGFWGARMIWTSIRALDTRLTVEDMDNCITMKLEYPHLIAGYDLVGQEDGGRPLKDILPELFWFRKQCAEEGVEIPFFFHAGECLGDGNETDQNLFDAILLGTRRIGHGFSLYKHPLLIEMVKDKKILVESCPISNEILRLCASVMSHPLPALLARGVTCALCNDDPAILGQDTAGMTHDFWQALQGWENLGLAGLGSLAENSVRWAAFEDQTSGEWLNDIKEASLGGGVRAERLQEWAVEWEHFCLWIVTEFGDEFKSEE